MDAFEARLAARIVAMGAHADDSLRSASRAANDPMEQRAAAQTVSMARQSDAALRSLHRIQAVREKQLARTHPAAMERAGYWFRETMYEINILRSSSKGYPKTGPETRQSRSPAGAIEGALGRSRRLGPHAP